MIAPCKYTDCDKGGTVDTNKDAYMFRGTGEFKTFAHYTCDIKHSKMDIPMTEDQIKYILSLIRADQVKGEPGMPNYVLDVYIAMERHVK